MASTLSQLASQAVLARSRNMLSRLPPSERAVAEVVLASPEHAVLLTISELAEQAKVSMSSVVRYCHSLEFEGYKAFKLALASELSKQPNDPLEDVQVGDDAMNIARKVISADIQALRQTLELLDGPSFQAAVDFFVAANKIEIYGIGLSASVATDAYFRFLRIGLNVAAVVDSHMQAVSASLLKQGDLAFVISHSGRSYESLRAAKLARQGGASVLSLTSFLNSPLAAESDLNLVSATGESAFRVESMASRIAHLSVIDSLYVAVAARRKTRSLKMLERTTNII